MSTVINCITGVISSPDRNDVGPSERAAPHGLDGEPDVYNIVRTGNRRKARRHDGRHIDAETITNNPAPKPDLSGVLLNDHGPISAGSYCDRPFSQCRDLHRERLIVERADAQLSMAVAT